MYKFHLSKLYDFIFASEYALASSFTFNYTVIVGGSGGESAVVEPIEGGVVYPVPVPPVTQQPGSEIV